MPQTSTETAYNSGLPFHCGINFMRHTIAAWCLTAIALFLLLQLHLLPALLAGLLVYVLTHRLAACLPRRFAQNNRAQLLAVGLLATLVICASAAALTGIGLFFRSEPSSLPNLLAKMADIIEGARSQLPESLASHIPENVAALKEIVTQWLREHAAELQRKGTEAILTMVHILLGMVIGGMLALQETRPATQPEGPLSAALTERVRRFAQAFQRIVLAQIKISAINSVLTALYLLVVLPLCGVHVPLAKTLVGVTFVAGLLPVAGNLISNFAIVVVSLSHSLEAAAASLVFLIVIHKFEYFLNARIVGSGIGARAWELLIAMLVMEAAFGMPGLVAAPIFYAYLKDELRGQHLI